MMIPEINAVDEPLNETEQPSLTWKLDFETGRVVGKIDELEAIKQAVHKILQTDRFYHLIYSTDYGHELAGLISTDPVIAESEIKRLVSEALLQDNRIREVELTDITIVTDSLTAQFLVTTDYGSFEIEVNENV